MTASPLPLIPYLSGVPAIGAAVGIVVLALFWILLLRPRRGSCKNAPPLVLTAKNNIPFIGVLIEFFSSPNTMVQRCVKDYGPVFTIPVRFL
jgi:hypothetical protein